MSVNTKKLFPDFLLIGAGKSGTTSLHNYLDQHPDIYMSKIKEPYFFALEGEDIVPPEKDPYKLYDFPWAVTNLEEYNKLFEPAKEGQKKGESSTMYLYGDKAPSNIKKYIPDVKIIAIFRKPSSRLYSRYLHLARENNLMGSSFDKVLDKNSIWWLRNDLVKEGFYYKHLSRYFKLFNEDQIKIFLYDDLKKEPEKVIRELYSFVGVDESFTPDVSIRFNQSGFVKNKALDKLYGTDSVIFKSVKSAMPGVFNKLKENLVIQKGLNKLRGKNLERPKIDPEIEKKLTFDIYYEDTLKFQDLINRDLSHWLK
ncbi:sulfotransferase family protein [Marinigracilibium pacificum]|uniref:Sulfotransferase n=1 Tax=Marinigracilibium pacificum TaxID=2729599 RepID=A0A848IZ02_9BACT|nr:sulfotransferase [Marinigracilibium pacificum]NMM47229.1 sulfotransferase [Marinigracilibium pacificum]